MKQPEETKPELEAEKPEAKPRRLPSVASLRPRGFVVREPPGMTYTFLPAASLKAREKLR
jgi:hypothetical protein